jgi:hypothetical protein
MSITRAFRTTSGAISTQYEGGVTAGFALRIGAPHLAMGRKIMYRDLPGEIIVARIPMRIDVGSRTRCATSRPGRSARIWRSYDDPGQFDVGAERAIAATDPGLGTWAGFGLIEADIGWAKLRAVAGGARLASQGAATAGRRAVNRQL